MMLETSSVIAFGLVCFGLVLTPGPNMVYLVSRSICQGRKAGLISLSGILLGFIFYMLCAALGITTLVMAIPFAYDVLRIGGAFYLLYLAWQAIRPGGHSSFQIQDLQKDSSRKLFVMGLVTSLLNPQVAVIYLSLLPQFMDPGRGGVLTQSIFLGLTHVTISMTVNAAIIVMAGSIASFLYRRPFWQEAQRWLMGTVLAGLAVRMFAEGRR
jgi:threonine/homoserine/homoserine lactone efflux protein